MIIVVSYFRYTKSTYYEYIQISQELKGKVIDVKIENEFSFSKIISMPFAFLEYGDIDLVHCRATIKYSNLNASETSFINKFPVTIPRDLDLIDLLYSPFKDKVIINDTFYLKGWLIISVIFSIKLFILGIIAFRI
jgi:hypothetical protein